MKQMSTVVLKGVIVLVAITVLTGMIVLPPMEGRATNLDLLHIYADPFVIYAYIASVPFFIGLHQAFALLRRIDADNAFSREGISILRNIKVASVSLVGFIAIALVYIRFMVHGDDPTGPTSLGIIVLFAVAIVATAAGIFEKLLQNVVEMKSENDLTV